MNPYTFFILNLCMLAPLLGQHETGCKILRSFETTAARQGVAIDDDSVFVISNHTIEKYDKITLEKQSEWSCEKGKPLIHLNAGTIHDNKLYCAHSNYPASPMTSSIEIWDTATLTHIESISFGVHAGSLTWVVYHEGSWWAGFAHYSGRGSEPGKDNTWTQVVRFDDNWHRLGGYVLPDSILSRFGTRSNSGGDWGPDGRLYLTGHDEAELYAMRLPRGGSELILDEIIEVPIQGQAFMWDRKHLGVLFGISKSEGKVMEVRINGLKPGRIPDSSVVRTFGPETIPSSMCFLRFLKGLSGIAM